MKGHAKGTYFTKAVIVMSLIVTSTPRAGMQHPTIGSKPHCVYIGGKSEAKNQQFLESSNISHILNVSGLPNYFELTKRFKYKRIDVSDDATTDLLSHADSIVAFVSSGLHHGSVLVHCRQGISRSPTCVAFFLMRKCGMTLDIALSTMKSCRPDVSPIPAFMAQLAKYEAYCQKQGLLTEQPLQGVKESVLIGPLRPAPPSAEQNVKKEERRMIGPSIPPNMKTTIAVSTSPLVEEGNNLVASTVDPDINSETSPPKVKGDSSGQGGEDPPRKRSRIGNSKENS